MLYLYYIRIPLDKNIKQNTNILFYLDANMRLTSICYSSLPFKTFLSFLKALPVSSAICASALAHNSRTDCPTLQALTMSLSTPTERQFEK